MGVKEFVLVPKGVYTTLLECQEKLDEHENSGSEHLGETTENTQPPDDSVIPPPVGKPYTGEITNEQGTQESGNHTVADHVEITQTDNNQITPVTNNNINVSRKSKPEQDHITPVTNHNKHTQQKRSKTSKTKKIKKVRNFTWLPY